MSISFASSLSDLPKNDQKSIVNKIAEGIKPIQALRLAKREQLSQKIDLPTDKYRVIYADPPWRYTERKILSDGDRISGELHYPSMSIKEICELDVKSLAQKNSVLFMWATFPLLEKALDVIREWGFTFKTSFIWDKQRYNVSGNYHSASSELLMIATCGNCSPDIDKLPDQIQAITRGKHSAKPEQFRTIIDHMYPSGKRIELFKRGKAPKGWDVWGNEAES